MLSPYSPSPPSVSQNRLVILRKIGEREEALLQRRSSSAMPQSRAEGYGPASSCGYRATMPTMPEDFKSV